MAATFTRIATVTVGSSGSSTIDFTSIPSTFTDLYLSASMRGDAAYNYTDVKVEFNSTTTGYTRRGIYGDGTSTGAVNDSTARFTTTNLATSTTSTYSNIRLYIPNYTSSNYKPISSNTSIENNTSSNNLNMLVSGLWSNTAAITSITLTPLTGGNFIQYSTATLYGINNS